MKRNTTTAQRRGLISTAVAVLVVAQGVNAMSSRPPSPEKNETTLVRKTIEVDGVKYSYAVHVPAEYTVERSWPLILFLHGSGERGWDGSRQTHVGIGPVIRRHPERFPCIVVMPQCPPDQIWGKATVNLVLEILNSTIQEYRIDQDRIALTGISLGGFGTWYIGAVHPELFSGGVRHLVYWRGPP